MRLQNHGSKTFKGFHMKAPTSRNFIWWAILMITYMVPCGYGIGQPTLEGQIEYIREQFRVINSRCASVEPLIFRSDTLHATGPMEIKSWRFKGSEIKMQATVHRESGKMITDYYFSNRGLIFAFVQEYLQDEFEQPYVRENRYYFQNEDRMIRWLDEDKKEVDPASERFREKEHDTWSEVQWLSEVFFMYGPKDSPSDTDRLSIGDHHFFGIAIGQKIEDVAGKLEKGLLKSGEGDFEVYYITDHHGARLGYIPAEGDRVLSIIITTPGASTWDGISVGSTFRQLKETLGKIEVHGSEIEGRTSVHQGYFQFLLDAYFYTYEVDETDIPADTKIKAIILRSPA